MVNGWKIAAIIFIILFTVETILFGWVMWIGYNILDKENECMYNICSDADTWYYDDWNKLCYCYVDHELVKQIYMGEK